MTSPILALQSAIVAALNADATLVSLLGGAKTFEHAPPTTNYPWIAFEQLSARDFSASVYPGHEHRCSLICVSRQPGTKEALAIAERVVEILQDAALSLDGHRLINLQTTNVEIIRAGKEPTRKARVSLRVVTEII